MMQKRLIALSCAIGVALAALAHDDPADARRHRGGGRYRARVSRSYSGGDYRDRLASRYVQYRDSYMRHRTSYQPVSYSSNARLMNEPVTRQRSTYAQTAPAPRPRQEAKPLAPVPAPGYITQEQAKNFKASGQTPGELIRQFGPPDRSGEGYVAYNVAGTSDGIMAPQTLSINIGGGRANSAYFFGQGVPR